MRVLWFGPCCLAFILNATAAVADPVEGLARCAAIESQAERINCYDELAKSLGLDRPTVSTAPIEGAGKWKVRSEVSPIDDSTNVYVSLDAEGVITGWASQTVRPILYARCKENRTQVYIVTGMTDAGDETKVRIRLDKEKAEAADWPNSTSGNAVFYPGNDISFLRRLLRHERMYFDITPFNSSPTATEFDLRGLAEAIKPLQKACHWKTSSNVDPGSGTNEPTNFASVLNSVKRLKEERNLSDEPLTAAEIGAIRAQIERCWTAPAGAREARVPVVEIRVSLSPDGSVFAMPEVLDGGRMASDPSFRAAAENAQRAVLKCSPLRMPPKKYDVWKQITLRIGQASSVD